MRPLRAEDPVVVGGYRLLGSLGAGGMGRVYLARTQGGRTVAVKVIRPEYADEPTFRTRFRREVDAARRVGGPWTAPLLDADPDAERPYLVTGYIPGPSLGRAVADYGPLPAPAVRALGAGLAEALIAVHSAGLVHRDLKPSNVLLSPDGPRVIDFGISRAIDASVLTTSGAVVGSPAFMSPEQVHGVEIGPASDVFSLGSVLVFAATGSGPFDGPAVPSVLHGVLTREPDLDAVPADLRELVRACLLKDPGARPSPRAVLSGLAPQGAAALMTAGWLPADLVTALSRQAVALLDLDTPSQPISPIGHTTPTGSIPGAGQVPGVGQVPAAGQDPRVGTGPGVGTGPPGAAHSGLVTVATPTPYPGPVPAPPGAIPPRSPGGGSQRLGLIAVAAAGFLGLAIIIVLAVLLATHAHGSAGGDGPNITATTSGPTASAAGAGPSSPSASTSPGSSTSPGGSSQPSATSTLRPGALPTGYIGTWQGDVTTEDGLITSHAVITLRAGESGQTLGHADLTLSHVSGLDLPIECTGDLRFAGFGGPGGDEVIVVDVPGSGKNPTLAGIPVCTEDGSTRLLLGSDGRLAYVSEDAAGGRPRGTLIRQQ